MPKTRDTSSSSSSFVANGSNFRLSFELSPEGFYNLTVGGVLQEVTRNAIKMDLGPVEEISYNRNAHRRSLLPTIKKRKKRHPSAITNAELVLHFLKKHPAGVKSGQVLEFFREKERNPSGAYTSLYELVKKGLARKKKNGETYDFFAL